MRTLESLTFHGALSNDVVKQLGVIGVHAPTAWTRHHLLLGVTTQMLPQLWAAFNSGFTIFPSTAYWKFTLACWDLYTETVHLHVAIKPLGILIRWLLTVLPKAHKIVWDFRDDVAVVVGNGAASNFRLGIENLLTELLQFGVVAVEEHVPSQLF